MDDIFTPRMKCQGHRDLFLPVFIRDFEYELLITFCAYKITSTYMNSSPYFTQKLDTLLF